MRKDYLKAIGTALKFGLLICTLTCWAEDQGAPPPDAPDATADSSQQQSEPQNPDSPDAQPAPPPDDQQNAQPTDQPSDQPADQSTQATDQPAEQQAEQPSDSKKSQQDTAADLKGIDNEEVLPDIEAKTFDVRTNRRSKSLRVYLFDRIPADDAGADAAAAPSAPAKTSGQNQDAVLDKAGPLPMPKVGKIILLTLNHESMMAFRVLKKYPDRNEFAASRVRMYGDRTLLDLGMKFSAIEKIADIAIPTYTTRDKQLDKQDLADIESQMKIVRVKKYDEELDRGTSPPPGDNPNALDRKVPSEESPDVDPDDVDEDDIEAITPDQIKNFDPDRQWLSLELAYMANTSITGGSVYYTGLGLRYGLTVSKNIFTHSNSAQDSLALEGGLFYYNILGYLSSTSTDSYTIVPFVGTVRYNLMFSEGFGMFAYGGLLKNNVMSQSGGTQASISQLSSFGFSLGLGTLVRLGPKWFIRGDLGFDMIGVGLTLRF
jgi:hypothetical protein